MAGIFPTVLNVATFSLVVCPSVDDDVINAWTLLPCWLFGCVFGRPRVCKNTAYSNL